MHVPLNPVSRREPVRWLSVILSSILWGAIPVYIGLQRPVEGRLYAWFMILTGILLVALLMHWLYAGEVRRLSGWRFWVYPLMSIPTAVAPLALFFVFAERSYEKRLLLDWPGGLLFSWALMAFQVAFASMTVLLWITYPFAILNQLIIRCIYQSEPPPPEPAA